MIQQRCLRIILDGYESNYNALLNRSSMKIKRLRTLAIEIFKTLNNQNPSFMRETFYRSPYLSHKKQNLFISIYLSIYLSICL